MSDDYLTQKEEHAILRLQKLVEEEGLDAKEIYIGHSGGKDSVAVTYIAYRALPYADLLLLHTPKPGITHPLTVQFLYCLGRPVLYCPAVYHKQLGFKVQIDGSRAAESDRTDGRSTDVVINDRAVSRRDLGLYVKAGLFGLGFIYPLFDWTDNEVWDLIYRRSLPYSKEYGNENPDRSPARG